MGIFYGTRPFLHSFPEARIAYSLRPLNGKAGNNILKVRRENDNTVIDVSFYDIQRGILEDFCAGTNGRVHTWYDQSGNGFNATQTTNSLQPTIVTSGAIETENNKYALSFNGVDQYLTVAATGTSGEYPLSTVSVFNKSVVLESVARIGSGSDRGAFGYVTGFNWHNNYYENNISKGLNTSTFSNSGNQVISMGFGTPSDSAIITNTLEKTIQIGLDTPSYNYLNGTLQEFIMYTTNLVALKNSMFNNLNTYYKVL
jgi:hypothetical protein